MYHSTTRFRRIAGTLAALPLAGTLAVLPAIIAASPAHAASLPYSGAANVDLVHLDAVNVPGLDLAYASISPSRSNVNSAGLTAADAPAPVGKNSYSRATNLDASLVSGSLPLNGQLVEADQSAPPDNPAAKVDGPLIPVSIPPLLDANAATASAQARWLTSGCIPVGTPITYGKSEVVNANVLPGFTGTGTVASLNNGNGGTVYTNTTIGLVNVAGQAGKGVQSKALTQLTQISLFGGQLSIAVVSPPTLTAVAAGTAGGSSVTYTEPVLTIMQGSTVIGTLDASNPSFQLPSNPLISLTLGTLTNKVVTATDASGDASLLDLQILPAPTVSTNPVVSLAIAKAHVAAHVPAGGVDCSVATPTATEDNPLRESHKDLSAASVNAGSTFDYTVAVPNRGNADITQVQVVDTVTPAGLVLVNAVPEPVTTAGNVYTFSLGTIAANQTKNILLTFRVPLGTPLGTTYHNHADITGIYKGLTYTQPADVNGPVVDSPGQGPCLLTDSNKASSHLEVRQGETFNWYVHVFNTGGQPCTNVMVTDQLESTVSFVSCTHACTNVGNAVTWSLGTLAPGQSDTVTVTVQTVAASGTLHNIAHITAEGATPANPEVNLPVVTGNSVLAPANPARRSDVLAFTGMSRAVGALALLLLVGAAFLRRALRWQGSRR